MLPSHRLRRMAPAAAVVVTLVAALLTVAAPTPASAAPTHYVRLSDNTLIAVNVDVPDHCSAATPCPTVFEMSGYENGSADGRTPSGDIADATGLPLPLQCGSRCEHSGFFDDEYVTVQASVRGTGCSTGEFDLFSWRSALDGREVIDRWIARQPWSNGDVAIFGHSYSGITGTMIAATRPRHLRAVSVSGLIDDLYRGITYPGGVTNYGFPLLWAGAVRPAYDIGGGVGGGMFPAPNERCARNQASKTRTVFNDPLVQGLSDTDNDWYRARSLITWIERVQVPTHITGAYQDEQTGPRGPAHLFEQLPDTISKRLVLTNGSHGTQTASNVRGDRLAWIDYWMLGRNVDRAFGRRLPRVFGPRSKATSTARVLLGNQRNGTFEGVIDSDVYPLSQTRWRDLYFTRRGTLSWRQPSRAGSHSWFNGSRRQSYSHEAGKNEGGEVSAASGPDELEFSHTVRRKTVIAGPLTTRLRISSTAPDTELFVQLIDRAPSGKMLYLQRGMLRASHRAITWSLSDRTPTGRVYRPWRPHTNPKLVREPGRPKNYLVEIFPVGHVLRKGHELVVKVHAPPLDDNDSVYIQKTLPGRNTLHIDPKRPSRILVPLIPLKEVRNLRPAPALCSYEQMRCVSPG